MIQYGVPLTQIFRIWEGGIVLYGGIVTGMLAFLAFYHLFLKKAGVSILETGGRRRAGACPRDRVWDVSAAS